jgi:site-specific recombinase XerD
VGLAISAGFQLLANRVPKGPSAFFGYVLKTTRPAHEGIQQSLFKDSTRPTKTTCELCRLTASVRVGNWLTAEEGKRLLGTEQADTLRSRRNRALLSVLIGCGLRRAEVTALKFEGLQLREGHWAIVDLRGKGGHVRTIPVPDWVKASVDTWAAGANITSGPLFRSINKPGKIWGDGFTPKVIWAIVKENAKSCGLSTVAPHDLRRTCARLCHQAGGELEQIQFLLGHVSIQTTERYLGCKQRFQNAVNDRIGLEPNPPS